MAKFPSLLLTTRYVLRSSQSGVAALVTIVAITLFLISASFLIVTNSGTSVFSGQYETQAARAQYAADAGIQDALIKLARNKDYTGTYSITTSDATVDISVSAGVVIIATSTVSAANTNVKRVIRADVTLDGDGKITAVTKTNL